MVCCEASSVVATIFRVLCDESRSTYLYIYFALTCSKYYVAKAVDSVQHLARVGCSHGGRFVSQVMAIDIQQTAQTRLLETVLDKTNT